MEEEKIIIEQKIKEEEIKNIFLMNPNKINIKNKEILNNLYSLTNIGHKKENQDISFCIKSKNNFDCVMGILDGHGIFGKMISHIVHDFFIKKISDFLNELKFFDDLKKNIHILTENFLKKCFDQIENDICNGNLKKNSELSGTTCSLLIKLKDYLYIASVGDSRIVLGFIDDNKIKSKRLTIDHRFNIKKEFDMVSKAGGVICSKNNKSNTLRVWLSKEKLKELNIKYNTPGLMVSRSIGDSIAKIAGCSSEPDILSLKIKSEYKFIIMASDGLWDVVTDDEAVELINNFKNENLSAKEATTNLMNFVMLKSKNDDLFLDNITISVMYL